MRRIIFIAAMLLLSVQLAQAMNTQDAKFFLKTGEDFVDVSTVADRDGEILVFKGSEGTLVLLRNETGTPLTPGESITALERMTISISDTEAAEFTTLARSVSESASNCQSVYNDFAKGTRGVCYESSYFKFQCSYLWTQGFYQNILPFDIVAAKYAITNGLKAIVEESPKLINAGNAFQQKDYSGAQAATTSVNNALAAAENFSKWHETMLTYKTFATNGALAQCKFKASELSRMANVLGATIDVGTEAGRFEAGKRINETLQRGLAKYYNALALSSFDDYSVQANEFSRDFASVRGARAFFTLEDDADLRELATKTSGNYEEALDNMRGFQKKLETAKSKLNAAKAVMPEYKRSAIIIESTRALARNNAGKLGGKTEEIERNLSEIETDFILMEQSLRMNANATVEKYAEINNRMKLLSEDIAHAAAEPEADSNGTLFGFSITHIIGFAVLLAAAAGLSYYYYRSRHSYY